jgi:hypothetical protein
MYSHIAHDARFPFASLRSKAQAASMQLGIYGLITVRGNKKDVLSEIQKPKSPHIPKQNAGEHEQDASAVIKGRRPFDHDRREGSTNLGTTNYTPAAFGSFWLHQKELAATRQCDYRYQHL